MLHGIPLLYLDAVVLRMVCFPTFGWFGWYSQQKNNLLGPRGFDARPFASKYARCRRSGQVLWVSGSFLSHGVTPVIIQTKMTISVRIKTHDPTGDSQFFFFDKNRPKLDLCGHPNDGTCDPLRFFVGWSKTWSGWYQLMLYCSGNHNYFDCTVWQCSLWTIL